MPTPKEKERRNQGWQKNQDVHAWNAWPEGKVGRMLI
jgi:hypothetical protein